MLRRLPLALASACTVAGLLAAQSFGAPVRPVTLTPWAWGSAGLGYVAAALALGGAFLWLAERLRRDTTPHRAMLLFHYSLLYLALLFAALALDVSI